MLSDSSVRPDGLKGADAPEERLVMSVQARILTLFTKQSSVRNRILGEFPWLWATRSSWSSSDYLKVINSTGAVLRQPTDPSFDYWVYVLDSAVQRVYHVGRGTGNTNLAEYATTTARVSGLNLKIVGIAWDERANTYGSSLIKVLRPPRNGSLHSLCMQVTTH